MSLRRFNPFSSNSSLSSRRNSAQTTRPPTYNSSITPTPTYASNVSPMLTLLMIMKWCRRSVQTCQMMYQVHFRNFASAGRTIPYLRCTMTRAVAPPHTVASLKHHLCRIEDISDVESTSLFISISSQAPIDDAECISLLHDTGPGLTEQEPMALVVKL